MRSTSTAVLERNTTLRGDYETEPYELPWAAEARFFVQLLDLSPDTELAVTTQISPDGLHWCDLDQPRQILQPGLVSWTANDFGQWLRLSLRLTGADPLAKVRIYLVGKS